MNILIVSGHNCIRVTKESIALRNMGHHLRLVSNQPRNSHIYETTNVYETVAQCKEAVRANAEWADLIHCHNEPSWFGYAIRSVTDKPVVFDYHDSQYWRMTETKVSGSLESIRWYDEDLSVDAADGFVVPSMACHDELITRTDKPVAVLPSAVPLELYYNDLRHFKGGLISNGGHVANMNAKYLNDWRDYTKLYKYLKQKNVEMTVCIPNISNDPKDKTEEHYRGIGCTVGTWAYSNLIGELALHSWNLVGNWTEKPQRVWDYALPNKLFDAIAAGTPSVVIGCAPAAEFVQKYDIGIVVEHPDELIARWDEHVDKRNKLMAQRERFSMESYAGALIDLYQTIIIKKETAQ